MVFCVVLCRPVFVLLSIVLSVLYIYTAFDSSVAIFMQQHPMEFMFHNLYVIEWIVSITFIFWRAQLLTQKSFATFDDLVIILIRKEISLHIILSKFMIHLQGHWMWKEALLYNTMKEWSLFNTKSIFQLYQSEKATLDEMRTTTLY